MKEHSRSALPAASWIVAALLVSSGVSAVDAQEKPVPPAEAVDTIEHIIGTLYQAVSFKSGQEPDWDLLRSLMMEDASFVMRRGDSRPILRATTEEFIQFYLQDLDLYNMRETGFYEQVGGNTITRFNRIAHCLVVFEMRTDPESEVPVGRGVDSIQLVHDAGRWWVASIATEHERPGRLIPEEFLKKPKSSPPPPPLAR
jgi:hypothetical protein